MKPERSFSVHFSLSEMFYLNIARNIFDSNEKYLWWMFAEQYDWEKMVKKGKLSSSIILSGPVTPIHSATPCWSSEGEWGKWWTSTRRLRTGPSLYTASKFLPAVSHQRVAENIPKFCSWRFCEFSFLKSDLIHSVWKKSFDWLSSTTFWIH